MTSGAARWIPPMGWRGTFVSFGAPAIVLLVTTRVAVPSVTRQLGLPPVVWFLAFGAFYVLAPLLVIALLRLRAESLEDVAVWRERLRFRAFDRGDRRAITAAFAVGVAASAAIGAILVASRILTAPPEFLLNSGDHALSRQELLMAWAAVGALGIIAQEILWRGVYLPRQERVYGHRAWRVNAFGWGLFLLPLGWPILLSLAPMVAAVPYIAQKRDSSLAGAALHALYFVAALVAVMYLG